MCQMKWLLNFESALLVYYYHTFLVFQMWPSLRERMLSIRPACIAGIDTIIHPSGLAVVDTSVVRDAPNYWYEGRVFQSGADDDKDICVSVSVAESCLNLSILCACDRYWIDA